MNEQRLIRSPGDYTKLYCYQKAEAIYDVTYYFAHKYLHWSDRTIGQMVQAARSGKQNISEGYTRLGTSTNLGLNLLDASKSSLIEVHEDYCDFLRTRNFAKWEENSIEWDAMRELGRKHNDSAFYMNIVQTRPPETIANMMICLLKQTDFLLAKLMQKVEEDFLKEGGFRERMTRMRLEVRNKKK